MGATEEHVMATWQAFLLGVMAAYTPGMILMAIMVRDAGLAPKEHEML